METFIKRSRIRVPVGTAFAWHEREGAIQRLTPPWAPMTLVSRRGKGVEKGVNVCFRLRLFGLPVIWEAEHIDYEKDRVFIDRQVRGPFSKWVHTHRFIPDGDHACIMEDHIQWQLPLGILSRPFYGLAKKDFDRMFHYRHQVLIRDLERHANRTASKTILVSGASGTIGSILIPFLKTCGHRVIQLVRSRKEPGPDQIFWDPYQGEIDLDGLAASAGRVDAVINLNGADISRGRWSPGRKQTIIDSRVIPTRFLARVMAQMDPKPEVFISSSAIGYYGDRGPEWLNEDTGRGDCFISRVCDQWEQAGDKARAAGIRTVLLRIGVVLTPAGGALKRMAPAFRVGLGPKLGSGSQYMSWISMEDALAGILHTLENKTVSGPVNLTAPSPETNQGFSTQLARIFSRPCFWGMPSCLIRLLWGQMGQETLLASARVKPERLLQTGFEFLYPGLDNALTFQLGSGARPDTIELDN